MRIARVIRLLVLATLVTTALLGGTQWPAGARAAAPPPPQLVNPSDTLADTSLFTGQAHGPCVATATFGQIPLGRRDIGPIYPEWQIVDPNHPLQALQGTVSAAHVSYQDWPTDHDSHDMTFHVDPDAASQRLLGSHIDPATGRPVPQDDIEVEWESGLASRTAAGGTYLSAGHTPGTALWNWPAPGDHVTVLGFWIWDRGHPNPQVNLRAETEIHPPKLLAINRALPTTFDPCADARARLAALQEQLRILQASVPAGGCGSDSPACEQKLAEIERWHQQHDAEMAALQTRLASGACQPILSTQVDVFASGQGTLSGQAFPVLPHDPLDPAAPAPRENTGSLGMNSRDYSFVATQSLPPPSPTAVLRARVARQPGDTFPGDPVVAPLGGSAQPSRMTVTIPWKTLRASNDTVFARTIYLYWDQGPGVPATYPIRHLLVNIQQVYVHSSLDAVGDGAYRVFAGAGSTRYFLNEFNGGLNDVGDEAIREVDVQVDVWVPAGRHLWVHASGWESDAADDFFGLGIDPNGPCSVARDFAQDQLFTSSTFFGGCDNDPIGEVNHEDPGPGQYNDASAGAIVDEPGCGETNPNDAYSLVFHMQNLPIPWASGPPGGI